MAQKKHKKRKQHTKSKTGAQQSAAQVSAQAEEPKKKSPLSSRKVNSSAKEKDYNKAPAKGKDGKPAKPSLWKRFTTYCKNVKIEMQRVVWPTRQELLNASLIVVGAIIFFGVYIAIIDNIVIIPLDWISSLGE